jgi:two-component system response regulator TctD
MRLLLVEDSPRLARSLLAGLAQAGMVVDAVVDGVQADQLLSGERYEAVVLDLALPRLDGLEVLRRARDRGNDVPVLILTASGETADRVRGLNAGADDYLSKPFDLAELVARLRALGRRRNGHPRALFALGALTFDSVAQLFRVSAQTLALPPREHQVLEVLIRHAGRPVRKATVCDRLCTLDDAVTPDAIEIYVHRLRKRLAGSGTQIRTLRGLGYLLEPAAATIESH